MAYIYMRYLPKIINIEFEGNRSIAQAAWDEAKSIIQQNPLSPSNNQHFSLDIHQFYCALTTSTTSPLNMSQYLIDMYKTDSVKYFIYDYFTPKLYEYGMSYAVNNLYKPESIIIKLLQVYFLNKLLHPINIFPNMKSSTKFRSGIFAVFENSLHTSRIDISLLDSYGNEVIFINSTDKFVYKENPKWLDNGRGLCIQSNQPIYGVTLEFSGSGQCEIKFRCPDLATKSGKRIALRVDYISIRIIQAQNPSNQLVFNKILGVSFSKPFVANFPVVEHSHYTIDIHYLPHDYTPEELGNMVQSYYGSLFSDWSSDY